MSHAVNDIVKENIMDEVMSMTVEEFQNAIDKHKLSGQTIVDEIIDNLIQSMFEQRGI